MCKVLCWNRSVSQTLLSVHSVISCRSVGAEDVSAVRMAKEPGDQAGQGAGLLRKVKHLLLVVEFYWQPSAFQHVP